MHCYTGVAEKFIAKLQRHPIEYYCSFNHNDTRLSSLIVLPFQIITLSCIYGNYQLWKCQYLLGKHVPFLTSRCWGRKRRRDNMFVKSVSNNGKIPRTRSTWRVQTSLAEADHYSHIAYCKNVEPWWWKSNPKSSGSLPTPRAGHATALWCFLLICSS